MSPGHVRQMACGLILSPLVQVNKRERERERERDVRESEHLFYLPQLLTVEHWNHQYTDKSKPGKQNFIQWPLTPATWAMF